MKGQSGKEAKAQSEKLIKELVYHEEHEEHETAA